VTIPTLLAFCRAVLTMLLAGLVLVPAASAAGELISEPAEVSFGAVSASEQRSLPVSIRNVGTESVTLGDAWLFYDEGVTVEPFSVDPGSCATLDVLEAGAACDMTASFTAPQQSGSFEALVVVEGDGAESAVVLLSGQAIPPPSGMLVAEPSRIEFRPTPLDSVSAPQQVRVRNVGSGAIAVPPATVSNPHFGVISNDCPAELVPGAWCTVGVVFKPTDGLPRPIGYAVGEDRHGGALTFGPRSLSMRRHSLAVSLFGRPTPRVVLPNPATMLVGPRLKSLVSSVPRALRGGPRHARLAVFRAPLAGTLVLRAYAGPIGHRVLLAKGRKRLIEGERHRLRISLTREGRRLLSRPRRTRVKVVLRFGAPADRFAAERSPALVVKPPKAKREQR
jgi:hypothetical protein